MEKIALLVPTRNRPKRLEAFWDSAVELASNVKNIKLYLYIDNDDEETLRKVEHDLRFRERIFYLRDRRIVMSQMVNELFPYVEEDILYFGADDLLMRTKGWDEVVIKAFSQIPDRIACLYGRDLAESQHPMDFATHPILHRNWVKGLGYLSPPYFSCDYADTWINELAAGVGRKFQIPIINEHMHYRVGKAIPDDTYRENWKRFQEDNVPQLYQYHEKERLQDIDKLKMFIERYGLYD